MRKMHLKMIPTMISQSVLYQLNISETVRKMLTLIIDYLFGHNLIRHYFISKCLICDNTANIVFYHFSLFFLC